MSILISSSIVNIDVDLMTKTVQLPPASENVGRMFLLHDINGTSGFPNVVNIATSGSDTIDYVAANNFYLATPFESLLFIAQNTSNYSVLMRGFNNFWQPS